jgi:hypothetical protein
MNRRQIEEWAGKYVFLTHWPFTSSVNTAEGKQYNGMQDRRKHWLLLRLTKGGMAMITDGENTISVPPFDLNYCCTVVTNIA